MPVSDPHLPDRPVTGGRLSRRAFLGRVGLGVAAGFALTLPGPCRPEGFDRIVTGRVAGFTVPVGQRWRISGAVRSTSNVVVEGTLVMRPGDELRFVEVDESAFVGRGMDPIASDVGLWVMGAGSLDVQGTSKTGWMRLTSDVPKGATSIMLPQAPIGWQVGDEIIITPTSDASPSGYDTSHIASISGPTITLDAPTTYHHDRIPVGRGVVLGAEVGNLTRDVVIGGTADGGSHVFIRSQSHQNIKHVRFEHLGPQKFQGRSNEDGPVHEKVLGRWALHFHHSDQGQRGDVVEGVVVTESGAHAFVAHNSHGITFRDCIAHRTAYAQFWWDGIPEEDYESFTDDTSYVHCLASWRLHSPEHDRQTGFDFRRGSGNRMQDCTAVGGEWGGRDTSGMAWLSGASRWSMQGLNVSHNNAWHGAFSWANTSGDFDIRNLVSYRNGTSGAFNGAYTNNTKYTDCIFYANGVRLHALNRDPPLTQEWVNCLFDAAGAESCVSVEDHNVENTRPIIIRGCEFRDPSVAHIRKEDEGVVEVLEIIDCTFSPGKPEFLMGPAPVGTEWRVRDPQHGSIALTPDQKPGAVWNPTWQAFVRAL